MLVVDGAQAAPHRWSTCRRWARLHAISGHKIAARGAGILWGRAELLSGWPPFLTGGEMIRKVELERTSWNELPWKFEAGTPAIAESIALGAAAEYLEAIGMDVIEAHEQALTEYAYGVLSGIDGVPPGRQATQPGRHPQLQRRRRASARCRPGARPEGIAVRAGHHCTQPLMRRFGLTATTRASVYIYNGRDDIDALADGIEKVKRTFAG